MSPLGIPCNQPPIGTITALDLKMRKVTWEIPAGTAEPLAGGLPMTYVSPKTGKQYVVISVGGAPYSVHIGDYVLAFALPQQK